MSRHTGAHNQQAEQTGPSKTCSIPAPAEATGTVQKSRWRRRAVGLSRLAAAVGVDLVHERGHLVVVELLEPLLYHRVLIVAELLCIRHVLVGDAEHVSGRPYDRPQPDVPKAGGGRRPEE